MAEVQTNLLERVRNGSEHLMIKAIVKNVFNEHHRQTKRKPRVFSNEELFEISLIFQRLFQLNLINTASVLECETPQNLYTEEVLKEIVINYSNKQPLSSVHEVKNGQKLPETSSKSLIEKKPMVPVSTLKDLRIFREKTNEEMVESRKLIHSRKPFREDDEDEEEDEDIDDDEEDDEHTNDDKESTGEEENNGSDGNSDVRSKVSDDTITSPSSSEEEVNPEWTKTLMSSQSKANKINENKSSKETLPTFPALSLQRLPPIIRPLADTLTSKEESPTSTDSEPKSDRKKRSITEKQVDSTLTEANRQEVEEISGELEELNFDDMSADFSDSAESISF
ncbi:unnamed protein product [Auanema sp. JU1783]|nr:unnamed protein product [Auanema sp. JU1783]